MECRYGMNRRQLLSIVSVSTATLAGCSLSNGDKSRRISTESEVRQQPTDNRTPVVRFSLTNESNNPITVSANNLKPFVYFPRLTGEFGSLVLLPGNDPHVYADVASNRTNSCWRFVDAKGDETDVITNSVIDQLTLKPGQTHTANQQLYYEGRESECFPDGDYTTDHPVEIHEVQKTISFSVQMTISDERISSVEVLR